MGSGMSKIYAIDRYQRPSSGEGPKHAETGTPPWDWAGKNILPSDATNAEMMDKVNSWKELLSRALKKSRRPAMVGIGQELRGDDAAGVVVVRTLQGSVGFPSPASAAQEGSLLLFEAGSLPEAAAGPLRRFGPDWVIFFDAADMGEAPGTICWIEPDQIDGVYGSTHAFPMGGFCHYLISELGCRVAIVGIQPKHLDFDSPVSDEVLRSISEIAALISGGGLNPMFVKS
jgi:hydrogenase 3 maturation protease